MSQFHLPVITSDVDHPTPPMGRAPTLSTDAAIQPPEADDFLLETDEDDLLVHEVSNDEVMVYIASVPALIRTKKKNLETFRGYLRDPNLAAADRTRLAQSFLALDLGSMSQEDPHIGRDSEDRFELTILPTEKCNLRCVYCYESYLKPIMSPELQEATLAFLAKKVTECESLILNWFGGEPLAAWSVIENIAPRAQKLAQDAGINFAMGIVTNATLLTPERAEKLAEWGLIAYQITLDGNEHWHNQRRVRANGTGTFNEVMAGLRVVKDCRSFLGNARIRLHYDRQSIASSLEFMDVLDQEFGRDQRFMLDVRAIWAYKDTKNIDGKIDLVDDDLETGSEQDAIIAKKKRIGLRSPVPSLDVGDASCYAGKRHALVLGADGTLFKCTVAFEMAENNVGRLNEDGTLALNENYERWIHAGRYKKEACGTCGLRKPCASGACPLITIKAELGEADRSRHAVPCPATKFRWKQAFQDSYHESLRQQNQRLKRERLKKMLLRKPDCDLVERANRLEIEGAESFDKESLIDEIVYVECYLGINGEEQNLENKSLPLNDVHSAVSQAAHSVHDEVFAVSMADAGLVHDVTITDGTVALKLLFSEHYSDANKTMLELRFRESLAQLGFKGGLSITHEKRTSSSFGRMIAPEF